MQNEFKIKKRIKVKRNIKCQKHVLNLISTGNLPHTICTIRPIRTHKQLSNKKNIDTYNVNMLFCQLYNVYINK